MTMSGTFPKGAHQMSDIYTVELVESEPYSGLNFLNFLIDISIKMENIQYSHLGLK